MSYHLGIDDISSTTLLEYFKPLEKYLEEAPLEQVIISTTPKPRTTKTTALPSKKPKVTKKLLVKSVVVNDTNALIQDDKTNKKDVKWFDTKISVETTTEGSNVNSASSEKKYVIIGIGSFLLVGVVIVMVVRRLKRKQRTNNRRFET